MTIKNLAHLTLQEIVDCFLAAFDGYFVKMPDDITYWHNRFTAARVDYNLSFGVFDDDKLVAFIINAIDLDKGLKTAYNTGTGVLPAYRGQQLVDKIYQYAIPILKENGVEVCQLEVIDENHRAIAVYERIGFHNIRRLKCYNGELRTSHNVFLQSFPVNELHYLEQSEYPYPWDNTRTTVTNVANTYDCYWVYRDSELQEKVGYFVINPQTKYVAQVERYAGDWEHIFAGVAQISSSIKMSNIDENRKDLIAYLAKMGVKNSIDQFEMEMKI